ncbi:glycoside hydrolase [Lojkania enalia]|uniref:Glycoside hydrolase n=1 Tax=Lojkania enalia TaxID=147567 RepID=A0A9P4N984_9PLEO|nr:glycoside hydrolase [Didymosphaeria enalia]
MRAANLISLATSFGLTFAEVYLGFNSGATTDSGDAKRQADFEKEFETAQKLKNSPGLFNSVRLYTNIQASTTDTPIEAFPAAVKTNTTLLLGIWCSGADNIDNELSALTKAVDQYGHNFTNLVIGISVGSEDIYRVSEDGLRNNAGLGQDTDTIIGFIRDVRDRIENTLLSNVPVGHVDTWSAWANNSNSEVIDEVDFVGTNLFPYYENDKDNDISNVTNLFENALNNTKRAAGDKPVWITETGWPSEGPDFGQAIATLDNAKIYWDTVGCTLFGKENIFWYTLRDSNPDNKAKFAITKDLSTTPIFDLTCPAEASAPPPINTNVPTDSATSLSLNTLAMIISMVFALAAGTA